MNQQASFVTKNVTPLQVIAASPVLPKTESPVEVTEPIPEGLLIY